MTKNTRNFLQKLFLTWLWLFGRLNPQASAWSPDEAIAWSKVISVSSCPVESTSELPLEFKLSWLISLTGVGDWTSDIFCKEKCLKITKHFLSRIRLFCSQIYNYDVFMRFKGTLDYPEPIFTRKLPKNNLVEKLVKMLWSTAKN